MKIKDESKNKELYQLRDNLFKLKQIATKTKTLNSLNKMTYDEALQSFELSQN